VPSSFNTLEENVIVGNGWGLLILGSGNLIRDNIISGNSGFGIYISGSRNIVEENKIGTEEDGFTELPNRVGVFVIRVGGFRAENVIRNNLISANQQRGISIISDSNTIENNRIGTTDDGKLYLGNGLGIEIRGWNNSIRNNLISGNETSGIIIARGGRNNITHNKIGTDITGENALGNAQHGVEIEGINSTDNWIRDNLISGNTQNGVFINGGRDNRIADNKIGTNATGTGPLGNGEDGILIIDAVSFTIIRNLISANGRNGITVAGSSDEETKRIFPYIIAHNTIGGDINKSDILAVMGNRENGIFIDRASDITITDNWVGYNNTSGILSSDSQSGLILRNTVHRNVLGIDISDNGSRDLRITGNIIRLNVTNINAVNAGLIIQNNVVFDGTGSGTGIHLTQSNAIIRGNLITGDAGDAIILEENSTALITKNNIFDNHGLGVNNLDQSITVDAQGNWWGDAGGPGGNTGDGVNAGVNFSNWLTQPASVVVAAEADSVILATGTEDTVSIFLQNWENFDDILDVSLSSEQGWLQQPADFTVHLADSLGAESEIVFAIPAATSDGSSDHVQVIATSQSDPASVDTVTFTVVSETAVLTALFLLPDSVTLAPGDSVQFTVEGYDQFNREFNFSPQWSATGGTIDAGGLYIAGNEAGTFKVTATDPDTELEMDAIVVIDGIVAIDDPVSSIPTEFRVYQNYPNPFNPQTTIQYDIPVVSDVRLEIFNVIGQRVTTLVNERQNPGTYTVTWTGQTRNGNSAASGMYIYRLQTNEYIGSKKLILLR
jgi:parallel beta-helix repeat protein